MISSMRKISILAFTAMLVIIVPGFTLDDYRTRIGVIPMANKTGDPQYDAVCTTVSDTVALVLRFLQDYLVSTSDEDPELELYIGEDVSSLQALGDKKGYDEILFGDAVSTPQGGFIFNLSIFNRIEGKVLINQQAEADSLLGVFDAADEITMKLISQISDVHIAFGSIDLIKAGGSGLYDVYLDNKKIRNPKKLFKKVLNGSYTISIHQNRLLGDTVVYEEKIDVFENQRTVVNFTIPKASEEEYQYIEKLKEVVLDKTRDKDSMDDFLRGIAEFQRETQKIDYDADLIERREQILEEVGASATKVLEDIINEADEKYFAEKPDFNKALEEYESVSRLVNNTFEYTVLDPSSMGADEEDEGNVLVQPFFIAAAGEDTLFIMEGATSLFIRSLNKNLEIIASTELQDWVEVDFKACTADTFNRFYYISPGTGEITVYNRYLEKSSRIPIPDYTPDDAKPVHLAVSPDGIFYIFDGESFIVFEPSEEPEIPPERDTIIENTLVDAFSTFEGNPLSKMFFDYFGRLCCYSIQGKKILICDPLGNLMSEVPVLKTEELSDITADNLGYFYITLPEEHSIVKYNQEGEIITSFGKFGNQPGEFSFPQGIAVNSEGSIYIADTYNNRIQALNLTAPPILLPEVSQFGTRFSGREEKTKDALRKIDNIRDQIRIGKAVGRFIGAGIFFGGSLGLEYASARLEQESLQSYADYRLAADPGELERLQSESENLWIFSKIFESAGYASFGIGTMMLTSDILMSIDYGTMKKRMISTLQTLPMDGKFELSEEKYKSLKRANNIGIWTGVMPPLLGGGTALVLSLVSDDFSIQRASQIVLGSVALPPIFSHLYGKRFHIGLFISSLVSDALALSALLSLRSWDPPEEQWSLSGEETTLADTWTAMKSRFPIYLMVGAVCSRLAAGVYDTNNGWKTAHTYNQYEAKKPAEVSFFPVMDIETGLGLSARISF